MKFHIVFAFAMVFLVLFTEFGKHFSTYTQAARTHDRALSEQNCNSFFLKKTNNIDFQLRIERFLLRLFCEVRRTGTSSSQSNPLSFSIGNDSILIYFDYFSLLVLLKCSFFSIVSSAAYESNGPESVLNRSFLYGCWWLLFAIFAHHLPSRPPKRKPRLNLI